MPCASPLMDGPPMDIYMTAGVKYWWSRRVHVGNPCRFRPSTRPSVATPARRADPISAGAVFYPSRDGSRAKRWCMLAPWCAGRPAGPRKSGAGFGDRAGLFRSQGSFIQNSASVTTRKAITHVSLPSPNLTFSPQWSQIDESPLL